MVSATLVCGPAGSGKSSYVREHMEPGDLVLDLDRITQALSDQPYHSDAPHLVPFACEARDAIIERLKKPSAVHHAWIIHGGARHRDRAPLLAAGAKLVVLAVPAEECMRRIESDPQRTEFQRPWREIVDRWWRVYEPVRSGQD